MPQALSGKRVALWFYGEGFRNRLAFELGAKEMGAAVAYVPGELGVHEPIEDIAGYLQNWFSMLVLRTKRHEDLLAVAARSSIPVINARTDRSHPCEILGDLLYLRERRGTLEEVKVAFVGEPSNLCMSWLEAAAVLPIRVFQVCPVGYEADRKAFLPYQIQPQHLDRLGTRGVFLPCPPVTRGEEVSAEAMRSPRCQNHAAKDNLLHVQNAIMETVAAAELGR